MDRHASLAMTKKVVIARNAVTRQSTGCHCEERSDVAIQDVRVHGSPRCARDDEEGCHCEERSDVAIQDFMDRHGLRPRDDEEGCHCEERSDVAIQDFMDRHASVIARSRRRRGNRDDEEGCHCEERSDVAIHKKAWMA